jgi:hypothetical protein
MRCPGLEKLIDYLDNRLAEPDRADVGRHLATGCTACGETRDWYASVRVAASTDDSVAPPPWVLKRAIRIFDAAPRPRLAERIGQAIASLIFDSFARPALAGVRSSETANRQLLYRAGDYSIDLQIAPSEETRAVLIGQILREGESNFESVSGLKLEIVQGETPVSSAVTDEMGEFKISGVKHGVYDLRVELSEGNITVPDLPIDQS